MNDCILRLSGQILTDNASFTPSIVTAAWRIIQNKLRTSGYTGISWLKGDFFVSGLPKSSATDFAVQNWINWAGFYNGTGAPNGSLVLPQNFMEPLDCWERPNAAANSIAVQVFRPMDRTLNGLPTNGPLQSRNINWDWRNGQLLFPGTTVVWDLRVTCLTYLADFPVSGGSIVGSTPVPIIDCLSPFANLIAAEFSNIRGDLDAKSFYDMADQEIAELYGRDIAQPTAVRKVSEYGPMKNAYTPGTQQPPPSQPPQPARGQVVNYGWHQYRFRIAELFRWRIIHGLSISGSRRRHQLRRRYAFRNYFRYSNSPRIHRHGGVHDDNQSRPHKLRHRNQWIRRDGTGET